MDILLKFIEDANKLKMILTCVTVTKTAIGVYGGDKKEIARFNFRRTPFLFTK